MTATPASTEARGLQLILGEARFALEPGRTYRVGRGSDNDIRINHGSVSESHCALRREADGVEVEDLGSTNGTILDGRKVQRATLQPGQSIRVGAIDAQLRWALPPPVVPKLAGTAPWRHRQPPSFQEVMADELRRAPWFTLSVLIHAALLLLFYLLADHPPPKKNGIVELTMAPSPTRNDIAEETVPEEKPVVEEAAAELEMQEDPFTESFQEPSAAEDFSEDFDPGMSGHEGTGWLTSLNGRGEGILGAGTVGGGGFRKTVGEIRRSGLEIVFVFDSTGSMGGILHGTKQKIGHMVELLHALVPDARIGLVTYRDETSREDYVTRSVPLSLDVYRAINFMQMIEAGGGGDRPEAVLRGLREALGQKWGREARRVIVLIGDAPAHKHDEHALKRELRRFASNGRSFVHAIVTSPNGHDQLPDDTLESFQKVAKAGHGECIPFENEAEVMQQVLSLAFGRQFRKNLDEASRLIDERRDRVSARMLDVVRRRDFEVIVRQLSRVPVSDDLVKALCKSRSRTIANAMLDFLGKRGAPEAGREAAAHVLQRMLNLRIPPNDPERGGPLSHAQVRALAGRIERQLTDE